MAALYRNLGYSFDLAAHVLDFEGSSSDAFLGASRPGHQTKQRRSRTEMMADVLRAIHGGAERPTQVMYKSNLSRLVCQDLLRHLSAKGFIRATADGDRRLYELTSEGVGVLGRFANAADEMKT